MCSLSALLSWRVPGEGDKGIAFFPYSGVEKRSRGRLKPDFFQVETLKPGFFLKKPPTILPQRKDFVFSDQSQHVFDDVWDGEAVNWSPLRIW